MAYGTAAGGDAYWLPQLGGANWKYATEDEKNEAIVSATILVDQLKYRGDKTDADQGGKFPRDGSADIPSAISSAVYEIAEQLLGREDTELNTRNLSLLQTNYGAMTTAIRVTNAVPDHLAAGIPSLVAWRYLLPYLKSSRSRRWC